MFDLQINKTTFVFVIWIAPTEGIHVLALEQQSNIAENNREFWRSTKLHSVDKWSSTSCQGVLNKWPKCNLHQLKQYCAENGLETFHTKTDEICLVAISLQANCIENWQDQDF